MAIPHPFKTRRTTGSPTAGGNVHTLAQHMASPQAHPQYVQKGDQVGSLNIGDHEMSSTAHRVHLLRRAELALAVEDFNSTKNVDPAYYDADHHTNIEIAYKTVITTALLNALLGSSNAIDSGPLSHILHKGELVHTEAVMNTLTNAVAQSRVPSMALIKLINSKIEDFLEKSVADTLYASIDHNHDGVYAFEEHTHSLYDVYVTVGGTKIYPARADHNHDDLYWRKDQPIESETDLSALASVGIYPESLTTSSNPEEIISLNKKDVQGHETFWIKRENIDARNKAGDIVRTIRDFPDQFLTSLQDIEFILAGEKGYTYRRSYDTARDSNKDYYKLVGSVYTLVDFETETFDPSTPYYHKIKLPLLASHDQIVATANLTTRSNTKTSETLSSDETFDLEGTDPAGSTLCHTVLQTLVTNASIKEFERAGSSETEKTLVKTYKDALHGVYTRNGYSFETALWISTVLSSCFAHTPMTLYGAGTESDTGDVVSAIADIANQRFSMLFAEYSNNPDSSMIPAGVTPGYMLVSGERYSGRKVRANRRYFLEEAATVLGMDYEDILELSDPEIVDRLNAADPDTVANAFVDYKLNCKYALGSGVQDKVVIHDISTWIARGTLTGSAFSVGNAFNSIHAATAFVPFEADSKYLPYVDYFAIDDRYVGVLDFVNPVNPSAYFIQQLIGGSYQYTPIQNATPSIARPFVDIDGECAAADAVNMVGKYDDLSTCPTGDINIDAESRLLHGYLHIKTAGDHYEETQDTAPQSGKTYYTWNSSSMQYTQFTGSEFVSGTKYYEKVTYNTVYRNDAEYYVMLNAKQSSGLNQFAKLIVGTHYAVGGPVGKDMTNHNLDLNATSVNPDAASNDVYMRVAVTQHTTSYRAITDAEREAGPRTDTKYYTYSDDEGYEVAEGLTEFADGIEYFIGVLTKGWIWSKKPVGANTRYNSNIQYFSYGSGTSWNDITDEVEEDTDGNVLLQNNRVIFTSWTDVYQAAVDPELLPDVPAPTATNILQRGLFYQSFDMAWLPGKRYYRQTTLGGRPVFTRVVDLPIDGTPPYGCTMNGDAIFEVIDVERLIDIWCAIRELTSTGAVQNVGSDTIVYNFGDSGNLITWDKWTRLISDRDDIIKSLQAAGPDLIDRLRALDSSTALATVWSNSHTHSNKAVLDKISGHKTGTEYDYLLIDMKRVAMYSDVSSLETLVYKFDKTATKTMEFKGSAQYDISGNNVDTRGGKYTLRITFKMLNPDQTITEIFKPTGSGFFTLFTLSPTTDRNYGVAGNVVLRSTSTGFTLYLGQSWSKNFTFDDFGRGLSLIISGSGQSTLRSVAISAASSRSSTIKTEVGQVDFGSTSQIINYVWLNNYLMCKVEKTHDYLTASADDIGIVAEAAARDYVPSKWMLPPNDQSKLSEIEYSHVETIAEDVMASNWSSQADEFQLVLNSAFPNISTFGEVRADLVLDVTTSTKHEIEHMPLVKKGNVFFPARIREIPDSSNPALKIIKVFDIQSLCTTVIDGTAQMLTALTDATAQVTLKLRVFFRGTSS